MATSPLIPPNTPTDPLAELRDIHLPATVDVWPPAPGWWLLAVIVLALCIFSLFKLWQWWRHNRYRREAVKQLNQILHAYEVDGDGARYLENYGTLLKRVISTFFGRNPRRSGTALKFTCQPEFMTIGKSSFWVILLEAKKTSWAPVS